MPPFAVAFVKGWRRSAALLTCCQAIRELDMLGQIPEEVKDARLQRVLYLSMCLFPLGVVPGLRSEVSVRSASGLSTPQLSHLTRCAPRSLPIEAGLFYEAVHLLQA